MSYDEQAMRRVVAERLAWAVEAAWLQLHRCQIVSNEGVAILAAEMLRQLPPWFPEERPSVQALGSDLVTR